ncbi:hypothetical protein ARALYDRAFT_483247, partial [Arabidopsis lyrata subsp. lyrata]
FLVVPIRSLSVGSSIVGVGVGTRSVNKRLMSNATVKSIPFSINNSKGKEVLEIVGAATDQNCHQMGSDSGRAEMGTLQDDRKDIEAMTVQELRATLRQETWATCERTQTRTYLNFTTSYGQQFTWYVTAHQEHTLFYFIKFIQKEEASSIISSEFLKTKEIIVSPSQTSEPWAVLAHTKPQKDWKAYNPKTMRPPYQRITKCVKVNGLRALLKLESFSALQLAQRKNIDILCLQETKIQVKDVEEIKKTLIDGYDHSFWSCSVSKLGYSGTAIISRLDIALGLIVTAEFDSFYLINTYVPNSGDGLKRLSYRIEEWDRTLSNHIKELEKSKPVVLTGDLNCAHEEIDVFNPAGNKRSAGFTIEERQSFGANFLAKGFVDTFRKQHLGVVGYTYWGYRHPWWPQNQQRFICLVSKLVKWSIIASIGLILKL